MIILLITLILLVVGTSTLWIVGITQMYDEHPGYNGEDLFGDEENNKQTKNKATMKTYKQLPIPSDTAWDRKSWKRYAPIWFLDFVNGLQNICRWWSVIWKDRHWDDHYIFEILRRKIELQREYLVNSNRHTRIPTDNRDMTNVLNLIDRVKEEYYSVEYLDYVKYKFDFIPTEDQHEGEDTFTMEQTIVSENYDTFLQKYPNSVRAIMKKDVRTATDKGLLCLHVAQYNQEKAHKLLFKILNERINYWWD